MGRLYVLMVMAGVLVVCASFSTDPPNGKTGAPGDAFCTECHVQPSTTLDGTITVEGFPSAITPNQTYTLTVVNRDTIGNAVRGGFQMTILGPTNTRAGTMASPSSSSALQMLGGRQYFEHHPALAYPDSNVVKWTVQWTAPDLPHGSIVSYYLAGIIANGNFQNTNDRMRTSIGTGTVMIAATDDVAHSKAQLFPNPGADALHVQTGDNPSPDGNVQFYNASGMAIAKTALVQGQVVMPDLAPGMYWLEIKIGTEVYMDRWIRL